MECHLPYGITHTSKHPTQVNTPHLNPSQTARYSIYLPQRDGRLSWLKWLVTYRDGLFVRPQTVTHPSTNRAQCRLTTLIEANALTTTLCCHSHSVSTYTKVYCTLAVGRCTMTVCNYFNIVSTGMTKSLSVTVKSVTITWSHHCHCRQWCEASWPQSA